MITLHGLLTAFLLINALLSWGHRRDMQEDINILERKVKKLENDKTGF